MAAGPKSLQHRHTPGQAHGKSHPHTATTPPLNYAVELERDALLSAVKCSQHGLILPRAPLAADELDYDGFAIGAYPLAGPAWHDRKKRFNSAHDAEIFLADHGYGANNTNTPWAIPQPINLWGQLFQAGINTDERAEIALGLCLGTRWCVPLFPATLSNPGMKTRQTTLQDHQTNVVTDPKICDAINATLGTNIDYHFLCEEEGGQWQRGYIPYRRKTGQVVQGSGLTIGSGLDLGRQSEKSLADMGLSMYYANLFRPYLGHPMRGMNHDAVCKHILATGPMPILRNKPEADELDRAAFTHYTNLISAAWNNAIDSSKLKNFTALSSAWQTVLLDFSYQYGSPGFITSNFWVKATAGNKTDAVNALLAMNDPRRTAEADKLAADDSSLTLPPPPPKPNPTKAAAAQPPAQPPVKKP